MATISCARRRMLDFSSGFSRNLASSKSSASDCSVTVFGATGFLGRYVVQQLASLGAQVFIPYRRSVEACKHLQIMGHSGQVTSPQIICMFSPRVSRQRKSEKSESPQGRVISPWVMDYLNSHALLIKQVVPLKLDVRDDESIGAAMAHSNVVINLIGRDYESHNFSFEEVNVGIPERISRLAQEHGCIDRYIHVSAIGASHESRAPQYRTKAAGEDVTFENFPEATILRPAHMVGAEDRLLNTWAGFAKKMPVVPVIGDGSNRFQPVHVIDVAAAVVAVMKSSNSSCARKVFELGGPDVFTVNELVSLVYETIGEEPKTLHIPFSVAKQISTEENLFKSIPDPTPKLITFSRNNIRSLRAHYCVSWGALTFMDLGIKPRKLEGDAIAHLHQYRTSKSNASTGVDAATGDPKCSQKS